MQKALFDAGFASWCGNAFENFCKFLPSKGNSQKSNVCNTSQQTYSTDSSKDLGGILDIAVSMVNWRVMI